MLTWAFVLHTLLSSTARVLLAAAALRHALVHRLLLGLLLLFLIRLRVRWVCQIVQECLKANDEPAPVPSTVHGRQALGRGSRWSVCVPKVHRHSTVIRDPASLVMGGSAQIRTSTARARSQCSSGVVLDQFEGGASIHQKISALQSHDLWLTSALIGHHFPPKL